MTSLYEERRKAQRFQLCLPCLISCSETGSSLLVAEVESLNISRSGACFIIDTPLACGFTVSMDFVIQNKAAAQSDYAAIYAKGTVIRSMKNSMAVCFDESYDILNIKRKLYLLRRQENWIKQFLDKTKTGEEICHYSNQQYFQEKI